MFGPSTPAGTVGISENAGGMAANNHSAARDSGILDGSDWNDPSNEMWYLPPGPAFFQNIDNTSVAMTAEGIHVGGLDLLEYMAMDPMDGQFGGMMEGNGY